MSELIKRDDAIECLEKVKECLVLDDQMFVDCLIDDIKRIEPFNKGINWIPCSERLPEDSDYHDLWETPDGAVLWCKATGEIGIGWYYESTKNWCDLWDNGVKDVIAWMPLPDPYKGEQE